jgi:pSer/pThr/pTyr-binding forkhead associated (FHA) protein/uncharacterized RDD family membrane protein YckC
MAKLLVHESAGVREFELVDSEIHIGRELDNTLRLPDPSISRHHCVIRRGAMGFEIQDLQSSNGVLLNGTRVQSSALRDGDRVTLGQIQLTFQDPDVGATVAIQAGAPAIQDNPLGTVRMSAEQMASIQGNTQAPKEKSTDEIAIGGAAAAPVVPPAATIPPPAPMAPPPVASAQPTQPPPGFGQFTAPGNQAGPSFATEAAVPTGNPSDQPPSFLASWLPPVPDDAQPTGERGELVQRLVATLIDFIPVMVIAIVFTVLSFIPLLGCILLPVHMLVQLGYRFFFVPWCVSKFGASIGKKMQKLRVIPEGNPSGRIELLPAILREFGNIAALNLIVLAIKGEERISLSDMLAKSEVIKVDR